MKIKIIHSPAPIKRPWAFYVLIGGCGLSRSYATRRACVRGLWRWIERLAKDLGLENGMIDPVYDIAYDAIRESRT